MPDTSSTNTQQGVDIYEYVAGLSRLEMIEAVTFSDGMRRKISCFFIDKVTMTPESCLYYIYRKRY